MMLAHPNCGNMSVPGELRTLISSQIDGIQDMDMDDKFFRRLEDLKVISDVFIEDRNDKVC